MSRHCFLLRVRPEALVDYRRSHAAVWPEMLEALRDAGWHNYSLHLAADGLVVGYVEADDFAAARRAMAATEVDARWQAAMAPLFVEPGRMQVLDEVFHLEDQLDAIGDEPGDGAGNEE